MADTPDTPAPLSGPALSEAVARECMGWTLRQVGDRPEESAWQGPNGGWVGYTLTALADVPSEDDANLGELVPHYLHRWVGPAWHPHEDVAQAVEVVKYVCRGLGMRWRVGNSSVSGDYFAEVEAPGGGPRVERTGTSPAEALCLACLAFVRERSKRCQ